MRKLAILGGALAALLPWPGQANGTLADCRRISKPDARLACYDGLVIPPAASAPPGPPAPPAAAKFGLEPPARPAETVESHIPGIFRGWGASSRIALANGQVWQVVDGSWLHGEWNEPRVVVRRRLLGGFELEIEGLNRRIGVRRIQ